MDTNLTPSSSSVDRSQGHNLACTGRSRPINLQFIRIPGICTVKPTSPGSLSTPTSTWNHVFRRQSSRLLL
ncbi:hypothetical protein A0H81_12721 [Grifola frondosa]|uniref:Uncharacterized protein n=1 Tax=Grifola frondosa TaxID=5627 RepID=A0A1C7LS09_GRIFR|nr:hypothetical protein A0H81_12721 [Grifola frondosa]